MNIDFSLYVQIINFLLLILLLNIWLYKPIRNILKRREEEFDSLSSSIEEFRRGMEERQKAIEEGLRKARQQGFIEKESIKEQGKKEEKNIVKRATSLVEEKINKAKSELDARIQEIRKALEADIAAFSEEVAEKILGRSIK